MAASLVAICNEITPGPAGRGVVLRGNPGNIPARRAMKSPGAGVQNIGSTGVLLAGVIVGIEVITVSARPITIAATGEVNLFRYFLGFQFNATRNTIAHLLARSIKRRLLDNLPFSVSMGGFRERAFNRKITANTWICLYPFCLASSWFDNLPVA